MPPDNNELTHGLFDSAALPGWTLPESQAPERSYDADEADNDRDAATPPPRAVPVARGSNFHLAGDRGLARGWPARARDNVAAIVLSKALEKSGRAPTAEEQAQLLRFIGFGASELAQNCFRRPGEPDFRPDWQDFGAALEAAVTAEEYTALQRATQYAHYTPETIISAIGRVLEPGMGTGLFFALLPASLRDACRLTGMEYDPITARIAPWCIPRRACGARIMHGAVSPAASISRSVIRRSPTVWCGPIPSRARLGCGCMTISSPARSRGRPPGGIALFVTSTGTMDKLDTTAREHIAGMADLVGAVRLPEGSMRASAGTEVVIDVLAFQRRAGGQARAGAAWIEVTSVACPMTDAGDGADVTDEADNAASSVLQVNRYFAEHPEMVLGEHATRRGLYSPGLTYTCRPRRDGATLETLLTIALDRLPAGIVTAPAAFVVDSDDDDAGDMTPDTAANGATIKEGAYRLDETGRLTQIVDGLPRGSSRSSVVGRSPREAC